jgi:tetratricopeptide (TPR) repeat protein
MRALRDAIVERASGRPAASRASALGRMLPAAAALVLTLVVAGGVVAAVRSFPALRAYLAPAPAAQAPQATSPRQRQIPIAATAVPAGSAIDRSAAEPAASKPVPALAPRAHVDLLARANQLRAQRRWRAAEALYLRVLAEQAGVQPSSTAALAAAELRLSQLGRPEGALALFERALSLQPDGPLAEQARHGIALSYRALGDRAGETRALENYDPHPAIKAPIAV